MFKGLHTQTSELYALRAYNLKILIASNFPLSNYEPEAAAWERQFECLKLLIAIKCPLSDLAAASAAFKGCVGCPKVCACKPQNYMPGGHII